MSTIHLNITQKCNQKCFFCVRSQAPVAEPTLSQIMEYAQAQKKIGADSCIITGGEPFTQSYIFDLLTQLKQLGFGRITIQTNGLLLSEEKICQRLLFSTVGVKCDISISLHSIHEKILYKITNVKNSLCRLIGALENLQKYGIPFCTNTVIFRDNIGELSDIARTSYRLGAYLTQFSLMRYTLLNLKKYAVGLEEVKEAAKKLAKELPMSQLRFEGIPFCLLRGMERCVAEAYWPKNLKLLTITGKQINDYKTDLLPQYRAKLPSCMNCMMNEICMGVWEEYFSELEQISPKPIC